MVRLPQKAADPLPATRQNRFGSVRSETLAQFVKPFDAHDEGCGLIAGIQLCQVIGHANKICPGKLRGRPGRPHQIDAAGHKEPQRRQHRSHDQGDLPQAPIAAEQQDRHHSQKRPLGRRRSKPYSPLLRHPAQPLLSQTGETLSTRSQDQVNRADLTKPKFVKILKILGRFRRQPFEIK